jgi:hypothetical protein
MLSHAVNKPCSTEMPFVISFSFIRFKLRKTKLESKDVWTFFAREKPFKDMLLHRMSLFDKNVSVGKF